MDVLNWVRAAWDRVLGGLLVVSGALLLIVGSVQVRGARYLADQLSFLMSAGLGGLACIALGSGLLVMASNHDEWCKLDSLERALQESIGSGSTATTVEAADGFTRGRGDRVISVLSGSAGRATASAAAAPTAGDL